MSPEQLEKFMRQAFDLGQTYWQQADSESYKQNKKSFETGNRFGTLIEAAKAALAKPVAVPVSYPEIPDNSKPVARVTGYSGGRCVIDAALAAPEQQPRAWMRKWAFDGDKPYKEKNANGRMAWPIRFKMLAVTKGKHFDDDVALYTAPVAAQREWVESGAMEPAEQQERRRKALAEPDQWKPYLKDGETPFERFTRERKDLDALLELYKQEKDKYAFVLRLCTHISGCTVEQVDAQIVKVMSEQPMEKP